MEKREITKTDPFKDGVPLYNIIKLVDDLYWEYDRMSADGKESLDKLAGLLGIEKEKI